MRLEVDGVEYEGFTRATATLRLDALSNFFEFEAAMPTGMSLPFTGGESCRVIVDGEPVITGYIEIVQGSYDSESHIVSVLGRDKTGDLIDSTLDALGDIKLTTLKGTIEQVIKSLGLDINVIDNAIPKAFNSAEDIATPEVGDNAFEFIESLARHRQVLLTSSFNGDVIIEDTPGVSSGGALQNILGAADNNIKTAAFTYDTTGRYNVYRFRSGLNPIAANSAGDVGVESIVNQNGAIIDTGVRNGRQLALISEGGWSSDENDARARWEANIRKARGRLYTATVVGYRATPGGFLWTPNTTVQVVDEFAKISATMLINAVTYDFSVDSGRTTKIQCVEENAYTLKLDEPVTQELGF